MIAYTCENCLVTNNTVVRRRKRTTSAISCVHLALCTECFALLHPSEARTALADVVDAEETTLP